MYGSRGNSTPPPPPPGGTLLPWPLRAHPGDNMEGKGVSRPGGRGEGMGVLGCGPGRGNDTMMLIDSIG